MKENVSIAIVAPVQPEDFFDQLWEGVWEATFDLSSFGVEVQNLTTERADVAGQRGILEGLLEANIDAIGLVPAHASALDDLINRHEARGTPVVTFYGDAPDSRRTVFVRAILKQAGALAAEVLVKQMGCRGRILTFPGAIEQFHYGRRYQGFRDALVHCKGAVEESTCPYSAQDLASMTDADMKRVFQRAAGFYVGTQELPEIASLLDRLNVHAPCVGFSNTARVRPFLERGVVSAVVDENRRLQGYFALQKAYEAVLKGEQKAQVTSVRIPNTVVFAANAEEMEDSLKDAFELLVRQRTEILCSYKDKLEQANAKLLSLSVTDPLTGLYNRRRFEEVMQQEAARALRYEPVSLLIIDVNLFKQVNDRYGHQAGDEALKAVADVLKSSCRTTDTCARLGGDEFAVILPHTDLAPAQVVRDRILQRIARTNVRIEDAEFPISLSIGIASLPSTAGDAASLIAAADAEMYRVKQASRQETGPGMLASVQATNYVETLDS